MSRTRQGNRRSFLLCKGELAERAAQPQQPFRASVFSGGKAVPRRNESPAPLSPPAPAPPIAPLSVMGIGSWPRPRWMLQALHDYLEHRLDEPSFQQTADDAVRLTVAAQERAGVDVVTDGEQRRNGAASFVGGRLDNCQLIPITDLLPYVEDPKHFEAELVRRWMSRPRRCVIQPCLGRWVGAVPLRFTNCVSRRTLTGKPIKVALPGPYLLTRTMWLECVSDRFYRGAGGAGPRRGPCSARGGAGSVGRRGLSGPAG